MKGSPADLLVAHNLEGFESSDFKSERSSSNHLAGIWQSSFSEHLYNEKDPYC